MSRSCLIHPENVCNLDVDGKCVCAPPGLSHDDRCATRRGYKCNCMVVVVSEPDPLAMALMLRALKRSSTNGEKT